MRHDFITKARLAVTCVALLGGIAGAQAQVTNLLLHYTNTWRYLDTGADPGADWAQPAFNDSAWPTGPGPFGIDDISPYPYPLAVQTPLALGSPSTPAHFLRTHFTVTNFPPGMELVAQCYLDDAMVLFLNGVEVQRLLMPSNQTYQTYSEQWSVYEGTNFIFRLTTNGMVSGENVLAVEVHQTSERSTDVFWGIKLSSFIPDPLVITRQPLSIATNSGAPAIFEVGVGGAPAVFQWFGKGVAITGATNRSYSIPSVQSIMAGGYQVVASNRLGAVTSAVATLTVVNDTFLPVLLSANATNIPPSSLTNAIVLEFSEVVLKSATNTANYVITNLETGAAVDVVHASHNNKNLVRLTVGTANWEIGGRYQITVNRIQDLAGNVIATNSQLSFVWPNRTRIPLIATNALWHYHSDYLADPAIVDSNWTLPDYRENAFWLQASGPFVQNLSGWSGCFAAPETPLQNQAHPSLFRIPFVWPEGVGSDATLRVSYMAKDGLGLFLNGAEIFRNNLAQSVNEPISSDTHAAGDAFFCSAVAVTVTNLAPGTNWIAASAFQQYYMGMTVATTNRIAFALAMDGEYIPASGTQEPHRPQLLVQRQAPDSVIFTWTGTNCILQRATSLATNASWSDVTPPTNAPVILPVDAAAGFFRLRQP